MQYFKPQDAHLFVGDCMPFFHAGTFHVFYLLDEDHHRALGGLGGHQWAHAASADLIHWTHYPLAIALTEEWEGSICTGSLLYAGGLFYGFYATRMRDQTQHVSLAISRDGMHFEKDGPNPLFSPPEGYDPHHFRDPFVFRNDATGRYHMLVTACRVDVPLPELGSCLAHLTSTDLRTWELQRPFLVPGFPDVPECPDYFYWNGWYYLIFSHGGAARYRISRVPFGPWQRPVVDLLDGGAARVMKTAAFTGDRRIGAAFVGSRKGGKDSGRLLFGGQMVLREIIQHADGSLGTRFPAELLPPQGDPLALVPTPLSPGATADWGRIQLQAAEGLEAAVLAGAPQDVRITATVRPAADSAQFGLVLRAGESLQSGYALRFLPFERRVELLDAALTCVDELAGDFTLDVLVQGDLIDVCIGRRRCLINRCSEHSGDRLFFFARNAAVVFDALEIRPLERG
jgi:glycosyl hydrolase family 32